jgi:hypothetical protein
VRAQPGARREGPVGPWNGRLEFALRSGQVELVGGPRSRRKELFVPLPPERVSERLLPPADGAQ